MRKMASIRRIDDIQPIPGADAIEVATVGGWRVVIKKGEFAVGDLAVYIEIDSWIGHDLAPFLSKGSEPREHNGVRGERLRTIKLRGQVSQGLLLSRYVVLDRLGEIHEGQDVSELLNIQKWEAPVPANLAGQARSMFPSWGKKTDAERCQNLLSEIKEAYDTDMQFEITIKLDGTSMSAGVGPNGEFHVCSRNLSLKLDQVGNTYVDVAEMYNLESKMLLLDRPLLISGEIIGEGIQKNQEKIKGQDFYVFNVWDPIRSEYLSADERKQIVLALGLKHAPVLHESITLRELGLDTVDKILKYAEGPSMNSGSREGLVFKSIDGKFMFKAVSNAWLTKND